MTTPGTPAVPARFVDLHVHSTASDGTRPPADVVAAAAKANLAAIALTDHDTLSGVVAAQAAGASLGVRVIAGVELSVLDEGRELHVLGLHIRRIDAIEPHLAAFRESRHTRALEIVAKLQQLNVPLTMDDVMKEAGAGVIGRPHIARALIARGFAADFRDAFDKWLSHGRPAYVEKLRLTIVDAIRLIRDTGGLSFFAHPGAEGTFARLTQLAALGMDGVEVRHPGHSPEDTARLSSLARELGMIESGGSDWHGAPNGARTLGTMRVPIEVLERQEERLAARPAAAGATSA